MTCRKCKGQFPKGSNEHIIPDALGGKTTTDLLYCECCNVALSSLDRALAESFGFPRTVLEISGKRSVPSFRVKDADGNPLVLKPGGRPVSTEPRMEITVKDGLKTFTAIVPPHLLDQYKKKIEAEIGTSIEKCVLRVVSDNRPVTDLRINNGTAAPI